VGSRFYQMPEEKRTDVNIALHMLNDAFLDVCDVFVLVSGDSDLVPVLNLTESKYPEKSINVYVPFQSHAKDRGASTEIRNAADKDGICL
jgi:uncharacterized LabA/DUF88 family protein